MNNPNKDRMTWIFAVLFALAGFMLRLNLDDYFDRIVQVRSDGESGLVGSFVLEVSRDSVEKEGENE